jgi:two-component system sensor histidine kinase MprB
MTIRRRITVATAVAVAATIIVVSFGAFLAARRQVLEPIDDSLLARASIVARAPARSFPENVFRADRGGVLLTPGGPGEFDAVYYQLIFPDGSLLDIGRDNLSLPAPATSDIPPGRASLRSERMGDLHLRIATLERPGSGIVVQIARPLTEADQTLARLAVMLAVGGAIGIALAVGLGALVSRSAVRPIGDLEASVGAIAQSGRIDERVSTDGDDEVASLAGAFNGLLDRLEESKAQQVRLVRDAGHELRTPLTALRMNLEVLRRHNIEGDERRAMLDAANAEVEELSDLVVEIVDVATDRYVEEPTTEVTLDEIVGRVVDRVQRRSGRTILVESDRSAVEGRPDALERVVTNIVANADLWTPPDGVITITVRDGGVTVADEGPGFDPADLPHVFERFYRSDRSRSSGGSGLGLSIVEQIITDHGGTVFARNRDGGVGAEVGFVL